MTKFSVCVFIFTLLHIGVECQNTYSAVASNVAFIVYKGESNGLPPHIFWASDIPAGYNFQSLCPPAVNISWIIHGWTEGYFVRNAWIEPVINSTLKEASGCVIIMDYSFYSKLGYGDLVSHYVNLRNVLVNATKVFGNFDRMHMFGFSFGARLAQGAGNVLTTENKNVTVIPRMDLCDPAGPDFHAGSSIRVNVTTAAKNVACINTSDDFGTNIYDCHQNFRMGRCGKWQDGQTNPPMMSHGMCPHIYNAAFKHDFVYNSLYQNECNKPLNLVNTTCRQTMIMGFRNRVFCHGDVLIPTARCKPWHSINGTINNFPVNKTSCI